MSKKRQNAEIYKPMSEEHFNKLEEQYQELAKVKAESEQIEEMTEIIFEARKKYVYSEEIAKALYNADYRKQNEGKWTKHLDEYDCEYAKCSCCKEEYYDANGEDTIDIFYKFCPNCGAKMKGSGQR